MFAIGIGTEMRNGSLFSLGALEIKCHKRGVYNFSSPVELSSIRCSQCELSIPLYLCCFCCFRFIVLFLEVMLLVKDPRLVMEF